MWAVWWSLAVAKKVEIPIDIGVGPAANLITGPVFADQPVHTGLVFSAEAVLDKKAIRSVQGQVPSQYRDMVRSMNEIRISHPLIPSQFFISPKGMLGGSTGMYGIGFEPIAVGIPLVDGPVRVSVDAGLLLTYAYLPSDTLGDTHFLRPGVGPRGEVEVPLSESFLISFGWQSQLYIPQAVGGSILELGALDESIWHIGQGFLKFHVRVPYMYETGGGRKKR